LPWIGDWIQVSRFRSGASRNPWGFSEWFLPDGDVWARVRDTVPGRLARDLPPDAAEIVRRNGRTLCIRMHFNGLLAAHCLHEFAREAD
jgi:hypothetical protein